MIQTYEDMIEAGATVDEAEKAVELFNLLRPCLKVKVGRVMTTAGSKTPLGLFRTVERVMKGR